MDETITAESIGKKVRALKHCKKTLEKLDKQGQAIIKLNCTGVELVVHKGDAFYLKIATTFAQLTEDINSYEIVRKSQLGERNERYSPAPVGAAPLSEVVDERLRAKRHEYNQRYYEKIKEKKQKPTT